MSELPFRERLVAFWLGPRDTIRIDSFRVVLGVCVLLYMIERWRYAKEWLTPAGFHVSAENLPYHPLWLPPLPESALPVFGLALFGSLVLVIVGWKLRVALPVALACVAYVTFADQLSAFTLNKLSIVSLAVLAVAPGGGWWSLEALGGRTGSVWAERVLQATLVIHYFTAGWSKAVFGDWLVDRYALWTHVQGVYRTGIAAVLLETLPREAWAFMQTGALFFELSAPALFCIPALRPLAFGWGLAFQTMILLTMHQLVYFMLVMFSFYVLFVPPEQLHRLRVALRPGAPRP